MDPQRQDERRKPYSRPILKVFGKFADLTEGAAAGPGDGVAFMIS